MKATKVGLASLAVFVLLGIANSYGQGHGTGQHAKSDMTGEIFCPAKSTGQLCGHGTADLLKLGGEKRQKWAEAAGRYNKAVAAATKQLLEDSKPVLSPEEYAQVEKWFAKGINADINRLVAAKEPTTK